MHTGPEGQQIPLFDTGISERDALLQLLSIISSAGHQGITGADLAGRSSAAHGQLRWADKQQLVILTGWSPTGEPAWRLTSHGRRMLDRSG